MGFETILPSGLRSLDNLGAKLYWVGKITSHITGPFIDKTFFNSASTFTSEEIFVKGS